MSEPSEDDAPLSERVRARINPVGTDLDIETGKCVTAYCSEAGECLAARPISPGSTTGQTHQLDATEQREMR